VCEGLNETVTAASCSQVELRFFMSVQLRSLMDSKLKRRSKHTVSGVTILSSRMPPQSDEMNMTNSPYFMSMLLPRLRSASRRMRNTVYVISSPSCALPTHIQKEIHGIFEPAAPCRSQINIKVPSVCRIISSWFTIAISQPIDRSCLVCIYM
jgi:hypothetical protein